LICIYAAASKDLMLTTPVPPFPAHQAKANPKKNEKKGKEKDRKYIYTVHLEHFHPSSVTLSSSFGSVRFALIDLV